MFEIESTGQFKKDLKRIKKRSRTQIESIQETIGLLKSHGFKGIPKKMRPHKLTGQYKGNWECHVLPDLLIVWLQIDDKEIIRLVRAGTHSDLFE